MKTVLITGSSRGIGLAIAHYLGQKDYQIILNSRKEFDDDFFDQCKDWTYSPAQVIGDVGDFSEAKRMVNEVVENFGSMDILINNAGINRDRLLLRMKEEDFDDVIHTNLKGIFNMCRHAIPKMLKQGSGTVINMSSVAGLAGNPGQVNYSASKAGVIGFTKALAKEVGSRNIRVNAIAPGLIESDMTAAMRDKDVEAVIQHVPLGRIGQAEEISQAVEFLINNQYVTGQTIQVNGGLYS